MENEIVLLQTSCFPTVSAFSTQLFDLYNLALQLTDLIALLTLLKLCDTGIFWRARPQNNLVCTYSGLMKRF